MTQSVGVESSAPATATSAAATAPSAAVPAAEPATLQGWLTDLADDQSRLDVLEKAFDFRGDVTLTLTDGAAVEGYLFDRRRGAGLAQSVVRLLPPVGDTPVVVPYDKVARVQFGRDAAHGKSFENWVKRYVEKKLKGEKASIESEAL